ncbi:MAG: IPT/TIG domain-containing protein, partial [Bryobacteraceae bacterium]
MQVQVFDDCGNLSAGSNVNLTFSNGDPLLSLSNLKNGSYAGTWTPASSASSVTISMKALHKTLAVDEFKMNGKLARGSATPPILFTGGVQNAASRRNSALIAPGGRLVLKGANFPDTVAGTTVLIGAASAKVVSSTPDEIQVVAPAQMELQPQTSVIVSARGIATSSETVAVVAADPGIYPLPEGTTAAPGASLTITATGLGGIGTNGQPTLRPTAKIGDLDAVIESISLSTTGGEGVYQLRITVPAGASGALPLSISQGGIGSNAVTVTVQ